MRSLRMSHRITLLCFGALALFAGIREATAGASSNHPKRDTQLKWATSELAVELEADRRHLPLQPREAQLACVRCNQLQQRRKAEAQPFQCEASEGQASCEGPKRIPQGRSQCEVFECLTESHCFALAH